MPEEVIKTTLAVDGAQFRREFQRSGQTLDQFARKSGQAVGFTTAQFAKMGEASRRQVMDLQRSVRAMQAQKRATDELRKSHGNAGLAALEASRAIEDFSVAGLRGALNNIPQLVMLLGGGGGLAAAFSLTAVGASVLLPKLKGLLGATKDLTEEMEGALRAQWETEDRTRALAAEKERLSDANRRYLGTLEQEVGSLEREVDAMDALNAKARMQAELTEELRRAKVAAGVEKDGGRDEAGQLARSVQMEKERLALLERQARAVTKRLEAERAAQGISQDELDAMEQQLRKAQMGLLRNIPGDVTFLGKGKGDFSDAEEFAQFVAKNQSKIIASIGAGVGDLFKLGALGPQGIGLTKKNIEEDLDEQRAMVRDIAQGARHVQELRRNLEEARAQMEAAQERGSGAMEMLRAAADRFHQAIQAQFTRVQAMEAQLKNQRAIEALPAPLEVPAGTAGVGAGMARVGQEFVRRQVEQRQRAAQLQGRRAEFGGEMRALQLEAAGRGAQAEELRREMGIRAEGLRLSKELGIEEEKGIGLARRKWALEEKIRKEKERQKELEDGGAAGEGRGRIRLFNEAESRERRRERQADGRDIRKLPSRLDGAQVGLRNGAMMRAQREREAREAAQRIPQEAAAPKWAADQNEILGKMLRVWEKMFN